MRITYHFPTFEPFLKLRDVMKCLPNAVNGQIDMAELIQLNNKISD